MSVRACKRNFPAYDARMSVKNLTIFGVLSFITACSRQPEVRVYLEEIQVPDQPSQAMRAAPLTVEPIPENLPEGHPTLNFGGGPILTDPNPPDRAMPQTAAAPMSPPSSAAPSAAPGAAPMMGRESEVPPPPAANDLAWEVPEGWRQNAGSGMRLATFSLEGDDTGALTTLIVLGAGAGGVEANITRWRGERGLPPEAPNAPMKVAGQLEFVFVDFVNESLEAGHELTTVGAIFDLGNRTAFLKFVGSPEVVARQRIPFLQLAGSMRQVEETP